MNKPSFIILEDGIQPVFSGRGFQVAQILHGVVVARYGKVYKTYGGALRLAAKLGSEK
jgi:hypothetical protein